MKERHMANDGPIGAFRVQIFRGQRQYFANFITETLRIKCNQCRGKVCVTMVQL